MKYLSVAEIAKLYCHFETTAPIIYDSKKPAVPENDIKKDILGRSLLISWDEIILKTHGHIPN